MKSEKHAFPLRSALILGILTLIGLIVAIIRYAQGLGAVTNLSDGRAWGLWISLDLYCGVALAAGGFTLAAAVYIFHMKKYYPIVRSAILTAFLGYLMVIVALLVDLGQPWRIWHIIIYWNPHSPLFEVGWCVLLYTTVLALEFSPAVFERFHKEGALRFIRSIQIILVVLGVVLSTLHQSSLGSVLLMFPEKLHALWYSPILPIQFFLSAVAVGLAMTIVEVYLAGKGLGHAIDPEILAGLGRGTVYALALYLVVKLVDLLVQGKLGLLFSSGVYSLLYWIEIIVGIIIPMVFLSRHTVREKPTSLFWNAVLVVFGLVLNRFDVSWFALASRPGTTYFPHWMEFAVSIGIIAAGILAYILAVHYLPIMQHKTTAEA